MMRKMVKAKPKEIEIDFEQRVLPGLKYCQRVGNIMGSVLLSLLSTIDQGNLIHPSELGVFLRIRLLFRILQWYCHSPRKEKLRRFRVEEQLNDRYHLSMGEYEELLVGSSAVKFGTRNVSLDLDLIQGRSR